MANNGFGFKWVQVMIWFAIFYFIGEPLKDFIVSGIIDPSLDFSSFKFGMLSISQFFSFSLYALMGYAAMYLFYPDRKWGLLFFGLVFSILIPIFTRWFIEQVVFDVLFGFTNYFGHTAISYLRDNIYFTFKYLAVGIGYFLWSFSIYKEKTANSLILENQKMQLSVLRSQVNPHFLLNSLNNIYSLVYQKSDKSLDALDRLSDLLKYNLYSKQDEVQLKEELEYLDKYVELQSIRYNYPINVIKNIDENTVDLDIPQLLLLPLFENAFKHGSLKGHPISLDISMTDKNILIKVSNKIGKLEKDNTSGVGLENVKNRLRLFYDGKAIFNTSEIDGSFNVYIEIPTK